MPQTMVLCLGILLAITIVNLRGVKDAGFAFLFPTYLFVGCLVITIAAGIVRPLLSGGHRVAVNPLPPPPAALQGVTYWLLLRVFASGCTALTGVEAVSNGVRAFREPRVKNAQLTLTIIIAILGVLLAGVSDLGEGDVICATGPGQPGSQSILSLLISDVCWRGGLLFLLF